jgi:hypothetical protein
MAITTKERTELRKDLVGQGYHWDYIDEWQPKVSLYRHRAMISPSGELVSDVGTKLDNLPGSPDYVNRKGRQGLYPWPPGDTCTCRWCAKREPVSQPIAPSAEKMAEKVVEKVVEEDRSPRRGKRRTGPWFQQS